MTHKRRTKGKAGMTVTFTSDMQLTMKKDQFLANKINKQHFVKMLSDSLMMSKCEVHHASGMLICSLCRKQWSQPEGRTLY